MLGVPPQILRLVKPKSSCKINRIKVFFFIKMSYTLHYLLLPKFHFAQLIDICFHYEVVNFTFFLHFRPPQLSSLAVSNHSPRKDMACAWVRDFIRYVGVNVLNIVDVLKKVVWGDPN